MTDPQFKLDIIFFSFSGQVRSLTYDVIKLRTVTKCRNLSTVQTLSVPMTEIFLQEDATFRRKQQAPGYSYFLYLEVFMHVIWHQVSHVTSPIKSLWGGGILKLLILQHTWYTPSSCRHIKCCCNTLPSCPPSLFLHFLTLLTSQMTSQDSFGDICIFRQ